MQPNVIPIIAADVVTTARMARLTREWAEIAGEPVTVEYLKGTFYCQCSELAAYRLERKYNNRPVCEAFFSRPRSTWMFRLETRF
jgi:hypothetical protein